LAACLADYEPLKVIDYQRAVGLVLGGTAYLVQGYDGHQLRSASFSMEWPAVVALKRYVSRRPRVKFCRANVLARDRYRCAYCNRVHPTRT